MRSDAPALLPVLPSRHQAGLLNMPPLTELLTLTLGPHAVIADEFAELAGVARVVIFGSWAARYDGERDRCRMTWTYSSWEPRIG